MKFIKKRWIIYLIIGVLFGIFDFVYAELTEGMINSTLSWILIAWLIWLLPIVPAVIYEVRSSYSIKKSVSSAVIIWCSAVVSYYLFMAFKLIFIGQDSMDFLYITNYHDAFYFRNLVSFFLGDVLSGILEWLSIALFGGSIVGFIVSSLYLKILGNKN